MNPSLFKGLHCFWPASDCLSTQTVNTSFLELTNNNAHFVLTCKTQKEHGKNDHHLNVYALKMRNTIQNNGVTFQHNKILTRYQEENASWNSLLSKRMLNTAVRSNKIISFLRCLLLASHKKRKRAMKPIKLRENHIFLLRNRVLLFKCVFFHKWQILNWLAPRTLLQKYTENYLFAVI